MKTATVALAGISVALCLLPARTKGDWTHYRGNQGDGIYPGPIRTNWTEIPPRVVWRVPSGPALSSLSIQNGRVFTQARRRVGSQNREFAVALNATTGEELWSANIDLADYPDGGVGNDDGPRSTPVVDGDRVFVFTSYLKLYCFDAATGGVVWQRDFPAELGARVIDWQNAASPIVMGDLVLVNSNAGSRCLMALRRSDGTEVWRAHDEGMTQATPAFATLGGVPQVIFFTQKGLIAVRPETGDVAWRFAFTPSLTSTAATPMVADGQVFCSAAYGVGGLTVRIQESAGQFTATQVWRQRGVHQLHWASPVFHQGHAFGVFGNSSYKVDCVDIDSGSATWKLDEQSRPERVGSGSVLKAGGFLLVQSAYGTLTLVELRTDFYSPIDEFQAFSGGSVRCWNTPSISDGILYTRSTLEIAAFDIAPPQPAEPLHLALLQGPSASSLHLRVTNADGSPVGAGRLTRIQVLSSKVVNAPIDDWVETGAPGALDNGHLVFEVTPTATDPVQFYRVAEDSVP